jgi:hypothetical protein
LSGFTAAAIEAALGLTSVGSNNVDNFAALKVTLPQFAGFATDAKPVHGIVIDPPAAAIGTIQDLYGVRVRDLWTLPAGNVWRAHAFWQEGVHDTNLFAGRFFQSAPATAPTDTDLLNNTVSVYLDEAGNNLKVRVRKSDGTYKTATVALV